jgi:SAM-dependent methyltransferase
MNNNKFLNTYKWPKNVPSLNKEMSDINNDFIHYWHKVLPKKYNIIENFNHKYPIKNAPPNFFKTLEIGAGNGEHLKYEKLTDIQKKNYYCIELREIMANDLINNFPFVNVIIGDCQKKLNFTDNYFDRIIAIHVLEHLPDLPNAIKEIYRLCKKTNGLFSIVIPCEGGLAYTIARKLSAQRIFEKRYKQKYDWFIEREHINSPNEIFSVINKYFNIVSTEYFPLKIKIQGLNLCIGACFSPKGEIIE